MMLNGVLAALVAVTAASGFVAPWAAVVIGLVSGVIAVLGVLWVERIGIDDPIGAVAVHGMSGVWGTLATGLFAVPALAATLKTGTGGLVYTGSFHQIWIQLLGLLAVGAFTFSASFGCLWVMNKLWGIRVEPEVETSGLDVSEHGMWGYPEFYIPVPGGYGTEAHSHLLAHQHELPPPRTRRKSPRLHSLRTCGTSSSTAAGRSESPVQGASSTSQGHIPGASYLDVDADLSAPPGNRGRHPLPAAEDVRRGGRSRGHRRRRLRRRLREHGRPGAALVAAPPLRARRVRGHRLRELARAAVVGRGGDRAGGLRPARAPRRHDHGGGARRPARRSADCSSSTHGCRSATAASRTRSTASPATSGREERAVHRPAPRGSPRGRGGGRLLRFGRDRDGPAPQPRAGGESRREAVSRLVERVEQLDLPSRMGPMLPASASSAARRQTHEPRSSGDLMAKRTRRSRVTSRSPRCPASPAGSAPPGWPPRGRRRPGTTARSLPAIETTSPTSTPAASARTSARERASATAARSASS